MGWFLPALIATVVSAGVSYVAARKAQREAKKLASEMSGVMDNIESNIQPIPVVYGERRVGGVRVYVKTTSADQGLKNEYLYMALVVSEGEVNSISNILIDNIPISDARFTGEPGIEDNLISYELKNGADDQTKSTLLAESSPSGWTDDHKLSGVAYIALKLKWDPDVFSSIPEVTAVVKGKKVYDPRDVAQSATDPSTWTWSDNPALCIRDYLTSERYGKGLPDTALDGPAFIQAANDCDNFVITPYSGATTTRRLFKCNAVIDTNVELFKNVQTLLLGCRAFMPYTKGKYSLKIDQAIAQSFTFTTDNIVNGITIAGEIKSEKFNQVIVKFPNPNTDWQPDQAAWPSQSSTTLTSFPNGSGGYYTEAELYQEFLDEDSGSYLTEELELETVTDYYAAVDLARIITLRSRSGKKVSLTANSDALDLAIGDVVQLNYPTAPSSWVNKLFQVEEMVMNYDATVEVTLMEYSDIYDYQTLAEENDYPEAGEPDPLEPLISPDITVTPGYQVGSDGTIDGYIDVSWNAINDAYVSGYQLDVTPTGGGSTLSYNTPGNSFRIDLPGSTAPRDVSVRTVSYIGGRSAVTANSVATNVSPGVKNAPPGVIASGTATLSPTLKGIVITWVNPTDSDFSHVQIKKSATATEPADSTAIDVNGETYTDTGYAVVTTRHYWIRSVDTTGNSSAWTYLGSATTTKAQNADLDTDSVDTDQIADSAVDTPQINNDAVNIDKISSSLQSTNYVAGTSGWKILKSGAVEFEEAIIRGTISATSGSISDTVTIGGTAASTIVAGASDGATALQDSDTDINLGLTGGTIAGITISGTKLYEGTGTFNNSNTGFYLDNTGQFSLKDKLSFDGSTLAVIGDITADNLNVTNATVTGSFVADNLPTLQNMNGVITVNQINANTITVDKLSGDVSETYPINYPSSIGVCSGSVVTNNDVRLTVPAPSGDVEKNATVSLTIKMSATNGYTSGTSTIVASCDLRLQRLSTGITTGTAIGASVVEVLSLTGNIKRLKIVGNHLDNLATIGSISRSSTGAVGFTITPVLGYYYQNTVTGYSGNFTYVFTSSSTDITVGSSFYFNKDAWQSQGVWISSENYERLYFQVQPQDTVTKDYTIHETLGKTLSGENFRLTATQYENTSGSNTPITVHNVSGTMQLIT